MFLKNFADIQALLRLYFASLPVIAPEAFANGEILYKSNLSALTNGTL